ALTEKEIVKKIFYEYLMEDESFLNHLEDLFYSAESDFSWMSVAVINFFSNPVKAAKEMKITEDKLKFGIQLIECYVEKNVYLQGLLDEKLINWKSIHFERNDIQIKSERITLLDKIMIKLGIVEMLYFNTIPINVTLNEYIDIANSYSTEKSGKFINGILDKLYVDFKNANLIQKINFK
ncbi:MAG: transcription antitermination protein NusB, partial [Sediminibacterium sp.]|nr:transcription antitermination protein NusB [Sediminibacterium sp.]